MIFQHRGDIEKIQSGEKTQARHIVKPSHCLNDDNTMIWHWGSLRNFYEVGKTYAVQPAPGKPAVARICILDIRREDVREISNEDVQAEGFTDYDDFLRVWCSVHDKQIELPLIPFHETPKIFGAFYRNELTDRPAACYDAWVLTFELVE